MIMIISSITNVIAASVNENDTRGTLTTTTVTINGDVIEIPVLRSEIRARSQSGIIQNTETLWIPDFSLITREENARNVAKIKTRSIDTDSFTDHEQYILFDTTLAYNTSVYHSPEGGYYDLVDLISFRISREIYSSAPFDGFRNPTATALQVGPIDGPAGDILPEIMDQKKIYGTINFNTTYSIPSSWHPVIPNIVGHNTGVLYQVVILPANGGQYTLAHWHLAN